MKNKKWIFLLAGVVFLLVVSGIVGWLVFQTRQTSYRESKIATFLDENATLPDGGTVFLGDSITDLYDLDRYFPDKGYINRGIGGDTTEGVLDRFDETVLPLRPSRIVLLIGVNDLNYGRSVEDTLESYARLVDHIRETLPDIVLYLISIYPVNGTSYAPLLLHKDKIVRLNEEIETLASERNATFVDIHPLLLREGSDLLDALVSDDGLHLNDAGYVIVTAVLGAILEP